jgi:hypothetical protein
MTRIAEVISRPFARESAAGAGVLQLTTGFRFFTEEELKR